MAAILELLRYQNFIAEDDTSTTTEGKFGIPRFNGEPTRLAEYAFRVRARTYKEKALGKEERDKLGPFGLRLVEGLSGTALRLAQTLKLEDLAKDDGAEKLLVAVGEAKAASTGQGALCCRRLRPWHLVTPERGADEFIRTPSQDVVPLSSCLQC